MKKASEKILTKGMQAQINCTTLTTKSFKKFYLK